MPLGSLRPRLALAIALGALGGLVSLGACDTGAVGIDACRAIEGARCDAAPACKPEFDEDAVKECREFYRDQCLHGIENKDHSPQSSEADACVNAIKAVETCARRSKKTIAECTSVELSADADGKATPCAILLNESGHGVHELNACALLATPPEAGSGGAGGGGTTAGTGGGTTTAGTGGGATTTSTSAGATTASAGGGATAAGTGGSN